MTATSPAGPPHLAAALKSLRIVIGTLGVTPLALMVATVFALPPGTGSGSSTWWPALLPVVSGAAGIWWGSRVPRLRAVRSAEDSAHIALEALRTRSLTASAVAESGAIMLLAASFVVEPPVPAIAVGMVVGAAATLWAGWPTRGRLQAYEQALRDQGQRVVLAP